MTDEKTIDIDSENISDISINSFKHRSRKHTLIAYGLLSLVFALLALAVYIFFFAQNIEARGDSAVALDRLNQEIKVQEIILPVLKKSLAVVQQQSEIGTASTQDELNVREELFQATNTLAVLKHRKELLIKFDYINESDTLKTKEENKVYLESLAEYSSSIKAFLEQEKLRYENGLISKPNLDKVEFKIIRIDSEIKKSNLREQGLPHASDYVNQSGNFEVIDIVRINIFRFGGISVTLFLIALLIPIYRYNIRLANFYMSRADALSVCRELKFGDFSEMVKLLTPTHAFEKEPVTPIDSIGTFTSAILSKKA